MLTLRDQSFRCAVAKSVDYCYFLDEIGCEGGMEQGVARLKMKKKKNATNFIKTGVFLALVFPAQ